MSMLMWVSCLGCEWLSVAQGLLLLYKQNVWPITFPLAYFSYPPLFWDHPSAGASNDVTSPAFVSSSVKGWYWIRSRNSYFPSLKISWRPTGSTNVVCVWTLCCGLYMTFKWVCDAQTLKTTGERYFQKPTKQDFHWKITFPLCHCIHMQYWSTVAGCNGLYFQSSEYHVAHLNSWEEFPEWNASDNDWAVGFLAG